MPFEGLDWPVVPEVGKVAGQDRAGRQVRPPGLGQWAAPGLVVNSRGSWLPAQLDSGPHSLQN